MTSLEVLSMCIRPDLLKQARSSETLLYPQVPLRVCRCLSHLARLWPVTGNGNESRPFIVARFTVNSLLTCADVGTEGRSAPSIR